MLKMYFLFQNVPESKNIEITKFVTYEKSINGFGYSILSQIKHCVLRIILLVTKKLFLPLYSNISQLNKYKQ